MLSVNVMGKELCKLQSEVEIHSVLLKLLELELM